MPRIRVDVLGEGQHPSERIIAVLTADGQRETVFVDEGSIEGQTIDAYPVGQANGRVLVELPRETTSGRWRIWVKQTDVLEGIPA